jgi:hypothetical protein
MNHPTRTIPLVAVIAVAALSGALAGAVVDRAAVAAPVMAVQQDPRLTRLLQYISVDSSGDVTVKGSRIRIQGTTVQINASTSASLQGVITTVQGEATTTIRGAIVRIN